MAQVAVNFFPLPADHDCTGDVSSTVRLEVPLEGVQYRCALPCQHCTIPLAFQISTEPGHAFAGMPCVPGARLSLQYVTPFTIASAWPQQCELIH